MNEYIELFVVPVPRKNIEDYRTLAELFVAVALDHGALSVIEVEADDAPVGKLTSFPRSVGLEPGETVFAGIMTFRSRAHRDQVNDKIMNDPRMAGMNAGAIPFDGKRMFWGGFKPFIPG
jgi:uncharacterized protein YbaA (DUF1428 family)